MRLEDIHNHKLQLQTLTDLFEALKMGGPQAAAAGESVRETCAALAVLANMGKSAAEADALAQKFIAEIKSICNL